MFVIFHYALVLILSSSLALCPSSSFVDSYSNLPALPQFPSLTYTEVTHEDYIENHYSEIAIMERPEAAIVATQTLCPHLGSGKFWEGVRGNGIDG
jgi:hypothetical protein